MTIKNHIKETLFHFGYIVRHLQPDELGYDAFRDMNRLSGVESGAILFDVGANVGQSIDSFRERFKSPIIHSFEPGPSAFARLQERTQGVPDLHLNNFALGAKPEERTFHENETSVLSSFLAAGRDGAGGNVIAKVAVPVNSIDNYCAHAGVMHIDVLKSDTQGFDFEVLKGALGMLREHRIHLVFVELMFLESYVGAPRFEELYAFLKDLGFVLMSFYKQLRNDSHLGPLAEIDGLFIDPQWRRS